MRLGGYKMKKYVIGIVTLFLLILTLPFQVQASENTGYNYSTNVDTWVNYAASKFAGGTGSSKNPYQISNASELALMAKLVNDTSTSKAYSRAYYVLKNNIDLSQHIWMPIGNGTMYEDSSISSDNNFFYGTFDGDNYTISGMNINTNLGLYYYGLFGGIIGYIKNVILKNARINFTDERVGWQLDNGMGSIIYVGGLAGICNTFNANHLQKIEHCVIEASITVNTTMSLSIGLVSGEFNYYDATNIKASGSINGNTARALWIGGFTGSINNYTTISECSVDAQIYGKNNGYIKEFPELESQGFRYVNYVGGFVGCGGRANSTISITDCYASGMVTSECDNGADVGGFAGVIEIVHDKAIYKNLYTTVKIVSNNPSHEADNSYVFANGILSNNIKKYATDWEVTNLCYCENDKIKVIGEDINGNIAIVKEHDTKAQYIDKIFKDNLKFNPTIWSFSTNKYPTLKIDKPGFKIDTNKTITAGEKTKISLSYWNMDAEPIVKWSVEDKTVAIIDKQGNVTAISKGTTKVYATTNIGIFTCIINVLEKDTKKTDTSTNNNDKKKNYLTVASSFTKLLGTKSFKLNAKSNTKITYSSSDRKVAVVSSKGIVTVKGIGYCIIKCKSKGCSKSVLIYIKPKTSTLTYYKSLKKQNITVKWKSTKSVTGYQIQYSLDKKFKNTSKIITVKGSKNANKTLSKLKRKATYYIRVRSYVKSNGKIIYSSWSQSKKAKAL